MKKTKISDFFLILYAISVYMNSYCMFRWSTYPYSSIRNIAIVLGICGPLCLIIVIMLSSGLLERKIKLKKKYLGILVCGFCLVVHMNFLGKFYHNFLNYSQLLALLSVVLILLLDNNKKMKLFEYIYKIFLVMTIPSLIYYLLSLVGISLPYSLLTSAHPSKIIAGWKYQHYPFGLVAVVPYTPNRFTGIFDEAGYVGTLCAMYFASGYKKIGKKWMVLLLLESILTFSMGCYVLLFIFIVAYSFKQGMVKFAVTLLILLISVVIFANLNFTNEALIKIQSRIDLGSRLLFVDNRTTSAFDNEFESFISNGGYELWMGNGYEAYGHNLNMISSFSYKNFLYDYGIVGFCMYITFFIIVFFSVSRSLNSLPFFVVFIASIYQRPYVFSTLFLTILILGLYYSKDSDHSHGVK